MRHRRRFGQHFLDPAWVDRVVAVLRPAPCDTVLEIGPGRGALTLALAGRVRRLIAIEIDRDLASSLTARVPNNVEVIAADVLQTDLAAAIGPGEPVRVAGNLPYGISTPILSRLLELSDAGRRVRDATVMLQREVADRLAAEPGGREWGVLSACQQLRADVEIVLRLPPGAFRPPPKVHSAVVRLAYHEANRSVPDVGLFERLVRSLFTQRRKMLVNALTAFATARAVEPADALARSNLDGRRRPETLTLEELARLADVFVSL